MKRLLSTVIAIALLVGLAGLAVVAGGGAKAPLAAAPARFASALSASGAQAEVETPAGASDVQAETAASAAAPDAPAAGAKYNAIALPIDNGIHLASELVSDVTATTGATALQALKWDPNAGWAVYDPTDPFSEDFSIVVGDALVLLMQGATTTVYSLVGDVPPSGSVSFDLVGATPTCKYNYISLPLDQDSITLASQLATAIGDVAQVLGEL